MQTTPAAPTPRAGAVAQHSKRPRGRSRLVGGVLSAAALLTGGAAAATTADAAGYVPCPSGYACLYDSSPQTGGYQGFYHYGSYNLSNVTGQHRFTNAQTGGAKAYLCTGYNGTGSCQLVSAGTTITRDFGPINSVYLSA